MGKGGINYFCGKLFRFYLNATYSSDTVKIQEIGFHESWNDLYC